MMKRQNLSRKIFFSFLEWWRATILVMENVKPNYKRMLVSAVFFFFLLLTPVWMLLSLKLSLFVEDIVDDFELWALG